MIRRKETLARFALEKGKITNEVKDKLFEPNRNLELSVSHVFDLDNKKIKEEGIDVIKRHKNATKLYGWAEITESRVDSAGLCVDYDDKPLRHAHILGWPKERDQRKKKRQILAENVIFSKRFPKPIEVKS